MEKKKLSAAERISRYREKMPKEDAWYRLDNSGALYPMLTTLNFQSLFRVGCSLSEDVDPALLQQALAESLARYPGFRVCLRQGFFRYYFDYNPDLPPVSADLGALFRKIDFRKNNNYLFRLTYFKHRISMDVWHCLTDGAGAIEFLKTILHTYLSKKHGALPTGDLIKCASDAPREEEQEDGFLKHYRSFKLTDGISKMTEGKVFKNHGKHFIRQGYGLIEGRVATSSLVSLSKAYGVSVTELIVAMLMLSFTKVYGEDILKHKTHDLVALVPINLRTIFETQTLRNFVMMAKPRLNANQTRHTLEDFCAVVKEEMKKHKDKDLLLDKLSFTSLVDKLWLLKILPQFIKTFFTKIGKVFSFTPQQTFIFSNLGRVSLPPEFAPFVQDFHFYVNCNSKSPENVAMISCGEQTVISFTRFLKSTKLDHAFFTTLASLGVKVDVASNFRELYRRRVLYALPKM